MDVLPMSIPCMLANFPHRPHYYLLVHWIHHYCVALQVSASDVCVCVGACLYMCACICVSPCVCVCVCMCVYLLLSSKHYMIHLLYTVCSSPPVQMLPSSPIIRP